MKRTISLILAALLTASLLAACGETAKEGPGHSSEETAITETGLSEPTLENAVPVTYATDILTENGTAKAHIVCPAGADQLLSLAAEELRYHIGKVSGAETPVVTEAGTDSLPVIIAIPESCPELETLFPEDLAWLRDTDGDETYKRYGSDGFAVRFAEGKLYIFGATARGALNGVYDFIEENLGVIWVRSDEDKGLICEEMPTVTLTATDYREKSPFDLRGRVIWGNISSDRETLVLMSRNKMNTELVELFDPAQIEYQSSLGFTPIVYGHNVTHWLTTSPLYDPDIDEYWETDRNGIHGDISSSNQVNFWSELTADTVAASMIAALDQYKESCHLKYVGVCENDFGFATGVYPEMNEPFEYAPGEFVDPSDHDYLSTVYFTFINRIARQIAEVHPDIIVPTYAYMIGAVPPRCELEDNVAVVFTFYNEDVSQPIDEPVGNAPERDYENFLGWFGKTENILSLNYYNCNAAMYAFERAVWDRMQGDFRFYASLGLVGAEDSGIGDTPDSFWWEEPYGGIRRGSNPEFTNDDCWALTALSQWIYHKLSWNPEEDVDALIREFCDKCYGEASAEMQEYYRLLEAMWTAGSEYILGEFNANVNWSSGAEYYFINFVDFVDPADGEYFPDKIIAALDTAYEAAEEETEKERIDHIRRLFVRFVEHFA